MRDLWSFFNQPDFVKRWQQLDKWVLAKRVWAMTFSWLFLQTLVGLVILAALLAYSVINAYVQRFGWPNDLFLTTYVTDAQAAWGQMGDFVGGILNPAFSFLTLLALLVTVRLQSSQLKLQRTELQDAKNTTKIIQRPWVTLVDFVPESYVYQGERYLEIHGRWSNGGLTAALKCDFHVKAEKTYMGQTEIDNYVTGSDGRNTAVLVSNKETRGGMWRLTENDTNLNVTGQQQLKVTAEVYYNNQFDTDRHHSKIVASLYVNGFHDDGSPKLHFDYLEEHSIAT